MLPGTYLVEVTGELIDTKFNIEGVPLYALLWATDAVSVGASPAFFIPPPCLMFTILDIEDVFLVPLNTILYIV
jgi:hypothetical protein